MRRICLLAWLFVAGIGQAQAPSAPPLLPGEALAMALPDGTVHAYGDAGRETALGGMAILPWLRLEGDEWATRAVEFKCTGELNGRRCGPPKGHGRVDLAKAVRVRCDQALLVWVQSSGQRWKRHLGDGVARFQLLEVFGPFLGQRLPAGEALPELGPEWVVDGDLLRASPRWLAAWLVDPHQEEALNRCRRLLQGFSGSLIRDSPWWVMVGTALDGAWAVGSNGEVVAVLRLSPGKGAADAQARLLGLLGFPARR